jgi:predicted permease
MHLFIELLSKIAPLYIVIFIGYLAGKLLHMERRPLAGFLIYLLAPIITFDGILRSQVTLKSFSIAVLFVVICTVLALVFWLVGAVLYHDYHKNLLALTSSSGNVGYFGLPIALMIFGEQALGYIVMSMLGVMIFQNTVAFFVAAGGRYSLARGLKKTLQVPTIYAAILAFIVKAAAYSLPAGIASGLTDLTAKITNTYSILGMVVVGLGLAAIKEFKFNFEIFKFAGLSFIAKFLVFPACTMLAIYLDHKYTHFLNTLAYKVLILMSIVPTPTNAMVIASTLKLDTDKIAITILLGNIFALFYIPLICVLFKLY